MMTDYVIESLPRLALRLRSSQQDCSGGYSAVIIRLALKLLLKHMCVLVLRARLSRGERESGQIPIRLWYCILSSRASNEVGVNIN